MKAIMLLFIFSISQPSFAQSAIGTIEGPTVICEGDSVKLHCDFSAILGWEVYSPTEYDTTVVKWGFSTGISGDISVFGKAQGIAKIKCYNTIEQYDTITETVISCPAGIPEISNTANTVIYPNPTAGKLIIKSPGRGECTVYNMPGQKVREFAISGNKEQEVRLDVPAGGYFVVVKTTNGILSQKVIISP